MIRRTVGLGDGRAEHLHRRVVEAFRRHADVSDHAAARPEHPELERRGLRPSQTVGAGARAEHRRLTSWCHRRVDHDPAGRSGNRSCRRVRRCSVPRGPRNRVLVDELRLGGATSQPHLDRIALGDRQRFGDRPRNLVPGGVFAQLPGRHERHADRYVGVGVDVRWLERRMRRYGRVHRDDGRQPVGYCDL
jgi:hypothetical protein